MSVLTPREREVINDDLYRDEGVRLKPYRDSRGIWTVGVGWNLEAHGLPAGVMRALCDNGGHFSDAIVETLLHRSLDAAIADAVKLLPGLGGMPFPTRRAIINMSFQLGYARLRGFRRMLTAVNLHAWDRAAVEILDSRYARVDCPARAARVAEWILSCEVAV
jgi:lysozyme